MFTQACFIRKNTYDLRHSLNNIGKTNCTQKVFPILISNYEIYYGVHDFEESIDNLMLNGFIDCSTNEELFLSIAALRDDSDRFQWFIHDDSDWNDDPNIFWYKCESESINDDMAFNLMCNDCRKATVEELIKKFSV